MLTAYGDAETKRGAFENGVKLPLTQPQVAGAPQQIMPLDFSYGSIAADRCPPKTALCLQCPDSDQILPRSGMSRRADSVAKVPKIWTVIFSAETYTSESRY